MGQRDGLGRFLPGSSGNPAGRNPSAGLKDALLRDLDRIVDGRSRLEQLAERLGDAALAGDPVALRLVVDRLWPSKLELGGSELVLRVLDYSDRREELDDDQAPTLDLAGAPRDLPQSKRPPAYDELPERFRPQEAETPAPAIPAPAAAPVPEAPRLVISRPWEHERQTWANRD